MAGPCGKDSNFKGKAGRSGPSTGNLNAFRNGRRTDRRRYVLGKLPKAMIAVERQAVGYRNGLRDTVLAQKGVLSKVDDRTINLAATAEMQAGILRWILRHRLEQMDARGIERNAKGQYEARCERDAAEKELGIDIDIEHDADPWGAVDSTPVIDNGADLKDK